MRRPALILLVEDNEADIELTLDAFREAHLDNEIHSCRNGQEALDYLFGAGEYADRGAYPLPDMGLGTNFTIYLPRCEERAHEENEAEPRPLAPGGTETILVAEDDGSARDSLVRSLTGAGYTVMMASDGRQAVDVFGAHASELDLVVLDMVMPKLNGLEVRDRIQLVAPEMRFLFTSGYSADIAVAAHLHEAGVRLIPKPYDRATLLRAIRETLDGVSDTSPPHPNQS